jgi:hypothetical protein
MYLASHLRACVSLRPRVQSADTYLPRTPTLLSGITEEVDCG